MAESYRRFLKRNIDLAPLGVEQRADSDPYFCTPKGASVIGWAGVDGIHYCFIRGFGEMVFAVSPANTAPDYVHPLAENFDDFLSLLSACGDAAALEQAWMWEKDQFDTFLRENPPTQPQKAVLAEIADKMKVTAMENPWQYVKGLQASFDYSKIKYTEDFYDPDMNEKAEPQIPEWNVYFDGNFWGHRGRERAGKEIPVGKAFHWAGRDWLVPAVYSCSRGLVLEFCMRTDPDRIQECFHFHPQILLNGKEIRPSYSCRISYRPCIPEGERNEPEAEQAIDHYGLDPSYGWTVCRFAFPWKTKRRPEIKTLSAVMEQRPVSVPGPHFYAAAPGDTFEFVHPESGKKYMLTVQEYEPQKMEVSHVGFAPGQEFPTHYFVMSYTIAPEIPDNELTICDCVDSDRPRRRNNDPFAPEESSSAIAIGIIGGADGPTAITFGGDRQGKLRAACSALHFEPVKEVEWRVIFHEKQFEDLSVRLL